MLRVQDLTVRYGDFTALDRLSFALRPGDWLMLVGPNGAGKSTAVKAIAQGVPYTGRVLLDGADVHAMPAALRAKKIGVLSQYNRVEYAYTVEEIVRLGRYAHERGIFSRRDADGPGKIEDALRRLLPPEESNDFCHRLVLHGRAVCNARSPKCADCCMNTFCRAGVKELKNGH